MENRVDSHKEIRHSYLGFAEKKLKQVKKNKLRRYINNKMLERSEFFPKNLAFMSLVKKNKQAKN
jgi:carbamate kinase